MKAKVNKKQLNKLSKSFKSYNASVKEFERLDKNLQDELSIHLFKIESKSSIDIEQEHKHFSCPATANC